MNKEVETSFRLETEEPSAFWKSVWLWWLCPKSWLLKKWETRGDTFFVTMWNGDRYRIQRGNYEAKYDKDNVGRRTLRIKLPNNKKIRIYEMVPMFPNGRADFNALVEEVGATKGMLTKATDILRVADNLLDRK